MWLNSSTQQMQKKYYKITAHVTKQITISKMYAVMADETRDGHTQQLGVCVHFVTEEGTPKEAFLGLHKLDKFDAKSIADGVYVHCYVHELNLVLSHSCRFSATPLSTTSSKKSRTN